MVTLMQGSGFCEGVRRAIDNAEKLHENISNGKPVYIYGDLVNNSYIMKGFKDKGYIVTDNAGEIPAHSIALIRAHGAPRSVYDEFKAKNITVKDCTCVKVSKIHEIVDAKSAEGYTIVVIGKAKHPEVIGIVGWCAANLVYVVERKTDINNIDLSGKVCAVAQTTYNKKQWEKITDLLIQKNSGIEIYNTLCGATGLREEKASELAASSGVMFVIGDCKSSNSRELYNKCKAECENTFSVHSLGDKINYQELCKQCSSQCDEKLFFHSLYEIESSKKNLFQSGKIGLCASASASDEVISGVYNYLLFTDMLRTSKKEIENASQEYMNDFRLKTIQNSYVQAALESLREQNEGGKRIRGAMIKLGEIIASRGKNNNYLPVAAGYELFQTSILIHDDIIDKSEIRRKKTTIHKKSENDIKSGSKIIARHYGVSRAICIGDYGFFLSYQFLGKCNVDNSVLTKLYQLFSQIFTITCEGEIMDVILPYQKISILDNYDEYASIVMQIYENKTAWYTLTGPITLGAVCGGANDELIALLKNITIPLGIAFQIKDDLLGIFSSEEELGKSMLSDIRENKQTLMYGYAYKNADNRQRALLDQHYGKEDADQHDLEIVRQLFTDVGAEKYAKNEILRLSNKGKKLIKNKMLDREYQSVLYGLVSYLIDRKL
jgi:4-hydroxy-3-methylbut-2-enyl diphosphate reductase